MNRTHSEPKRILSSPERLRQEHLLSQEFVSGMQNKIDLLRSQHGAQRLFLCEGERQLLKRTIYENAGIVQGLAAGALAMASLRRGPILLGRYIQRRWGPKRTESPHSRNKSISVTNSPFKETPIVPPNESPLMKAGWWTIDATLSCAVAVVTASATTDQEGILQSLSQVPRIPESRIAENFCPEMLSILNEMKERDTALALVEFPQSVLLEAMVDFARGCKQRENRIRLISDRDNILAEEIVFHNDTVFERE